MVDHNDSGFITVCIRMVNVHDEVEPDPVTVRGHHTYGQHTAQLRRVPVGEYWKYRDKGQNENWYEKLKSLKCIKWL